LLLVSFMLPTHKYSLVEAFTKTNSIIFFFLKMGCYFRRYKRVKIYLMSRLQKLNFPPPTSFKGMERITPSWIRKENSSRQ
jgi:hypothetical protein